MIRRHEKEKRVKLTIPKNLILFENSKNSHNKNKNLNEKQKDDQKENEEFRNLHFHFFKKFKLKSPLNMKENNKNSHFIKREKTKSLEINFLTIDNEKGSTVEKYENLPQIDYKTKTKHLISKSQINFKTILSPENNENNNSNCTNKYRANFVVDKKLSSPDSKNSKRVIFTKCAANENSNFIFMGKSEDNKKFGNKAETNHFNCNNNSSNNNNSIIKNHFSMNSSINNINCNKENKNDINIYDYSIQNQNFQNNNINIYNICEMPLEADSNNVNNSGDYIQIQESQFCNYAKKDSNKRNSNQLNNSINNANNSNSNVSQYLEKTPIKSKKILKTHFKNFSTHVKNLDLNFNGIYDKISNPSTYRTNFYEEIISKKISNKLQKFGCDENNQIDFYNINEITNLNSYMNNKNNYYKEEQEMMIRTSNSNIKRNLVPYNDFENENNISNCNNFTIRKSIINSSCKGNPNTGSAGASTQMNFFKQRKNVKKFI